MQDITLRTRCLEKKLQQLRRILTDLQTLSSLQAERKKFRTTALQQNFHHMLNMQLPYLVKNRTSTTDTKCMVADRVIAKFPDAIFFETRV